MLVFAIRPAGRVNRVAGAFLLLTGSADLMWHLMWYSDTVEEAGLYAHVGNWYALAPPFLAILLVHELYPAEPPSRRRRWVVWTSFALMVGLAVAFWQDPGFLIEGAHNPPNGRGGFKRGAGHTLVAAAAWGAQAIATVTSARAAASSARTTAARRQAALVGLSFLILILHTSATTTLGQTTRYAFGETGLSPETLLLLSVCVASMAGVAYSIPRIRSAFDGHPRAWVTFAILATGLIALGDSVWHITNRAWGMPRPEWWPWWRVGLALTSGTVLALALVRFGIVAFGDATRRRVHLMANASLLVLLLGLPASVAVWLLDGSYAGVAAAVFLALVGITLAPSPLRVVGGAVARFLSPEADPEAAAGERARLYLDALEARAGSRGGVPESDDRALASLRRELGLAADDHARLAGVLSAQRRLNSGASRPLLGRYVVEEELGRGAFGTALLAHDIGTGKRVVLKRYHAEGVEGRALDEARALARVRNPRVVPLLAVERAGDEVFLVLEHLTGGTVEELLQREVALPPDRAVQLLVDVLDGLAALHAAGLAHGDVKPSNLLLDQEGRGVLADLGSSQALDSPDADATLTSSPVIGSFSTVAPEVLRGHRRSPRADVYSAGAVLYRLLTGEDYVDLKGRTPVELMHIVLHEHPRLPHPRVPGRLAPVLARSLEKDPDARYADAREMRNALLENEPAPPVRTTAHQRR